MRVSVISIPVTDQGKALEFYTEKLIPNVLHHSAVLQISVEYCIDYELSSNIVLECFVFLEYYVFEVLSFLLIVAYSRVLSRNCPLFQSDNGYWQHTGFLDHPRQYYPLSQTFV